MFLLPNRLLLIRYKLNELKMCIRKLYLKKLGMEIGINSTIGKIYVPSPNSVKIGHNCEIRKGSSFWVQSPFNTQNGIVVGDNTFLGEKIEFNCCGQIIIGNNCLIASNVIFVDSKHTFFRSENIQDQPIDIQPIIVNDDVWIGSGAILLKGVTIGKGAIVGANSLVNKNIPSYEIWAGSPARKIGERK